MDDAIIPLAQNGSSFARLHILLSSIALLPAVARLCRRAYFRVQVEPGNISAATPTFTTPGKPSHTASLDVPLALCTKTNRPVNVAVELWSVVSEFDHKMLGHVESTVDQLLATAETPVRMELTRRRGEIPAGTLLLSAEVMRCPRAVSIVYALSDGATNDHQAGFFLFVVLAVVGLQDGAEPSVQVRVRDSTEPPCWTDVGQQVGEQFVWNHQFEFRMRLNQLSETKVELSLQCNDEAETAILASTTVPISSIECSDSWLTLSPKSQNRVRTEDGVFRIHIAQCWMVDEVKGENSDGGLVADDQCMLADVDEQVDSVLNPPVEDELNSITSGTVISLGTTLVFTVHGICNLPPQSVKLIKAFLISCKRNDQKLQIRLQLFPAQTRGQKSATCGVLGSLARIVADHCDGHVCVAFDSGATLELSLPPEVATSLVSDAQPTIASMSAYRVAVRVQPAVSKLWYLSGEFALQPILRDLSVKSNISRRFALLSQEEEIGGELLLTMAYNSPECQTSLDHLPSAVREQQPRRVVCQVLRLQPSTNMSDEYSDDNESLSLRFWSSSTGRMRSIMISPLHWTVRDHQQAVMSGFVALNSPVFDMDCEVFHVELLRDRVNKQAEIVGVGDFTYQNDVSLVHQLDPLTTNEQALTSDKCVILVDPSKPSELVAIAQIDLRMSIISCDALTNEEAMSELPRFRNLSQQLTYCEGRSQLELNLQEVQQLPSTVQRLDTVSVEFRQAHSRWSASSSRKPTSSNVMGGLSANFNESFKSSVQWSPKDRVIPTLHIVIKHHPAATPSDKFSNSTSGHILPPAVRLIPIGRSEERKKRSADIVSEVQLGTLTIDLCVFFAQPNNWIQLFLSVPRASGMQTAETKEANPIVTLLSLRIVSSSYNDPSITAVPNQSLQDPVRIVDGDVCLHVRHASGALLRANTDHQTKYYSTFTCGSARAMTRPSEMSADGTMVWNEHISLSVQCPAFPILSVSMYKQSADAGGVVGQNSQLVGIASWPLLPMFTSSQHLVQLELPMGVPSPATDSDVQPLRRNGVLVLDVQFLPRSAPRTASKEDLELTIHESRRLSREQGIDGSSTPLAFVVLDIYATKHATTERISASKQCIVALGTQESTKIGQTAKLSSVELSDCGGAIVVVEICRLNGDKLGRVHIPLQKDWKERLLAPAARPKWYTIYTEHNADAAVKPAIQLSFQRPQDSKAAASVSRIEQQIHLAVVAVIPSGWMPDVMAPTDAYIELSVNSRSLDDACSKPRRTRKAPWSNSKSAWQWNNTWLSFGLQGGKDDVELQILFATGDDSHPRRFRGMLAIPASVQQHAPLVRDEWILLDAQDDDMNATPGSALLHTQLAYVPVLHGAICLDFGDMHMIDRSRSGSLSGASFVVGSLHNKCYAVNVGNPHQAIDTDSALSGRHAELRIPIDLTAPMPRSPSVSLQWVVDRKNMGDTCVGCCEIGASTIYQVLATSCVGKADADSEAIFEWYAFHDKMDTSVVTGVIAIKISFQSDMGQSKVALQKNDARLPSCATVQEQAKLLAIWKKFFYLIDTDASGLIDLKEFTEVFSGHLADLNATSDGKCLLRFLFDAKVDNDQAPSINDIRSLFAEMDTNGDQTIAWEEFVDFLRRRQPRASDFPDRANESHAVVAPSEPSSGTEGRRKKREDRPVTKREIPPGIEPSTDTGKTTRLARTQAATPLGKGEIQLRAALISLQASLEIEKQKYSKLHSEWQALQRSYQQLHLKSQQDALQGDIRSKRLQETLLQQAEMLRIRDQQRKQQDEASIVLQSKLRARLEQRRYHGAKMVRVNAVTTLQCFFRRWRAVNQLKALRAREREQKARWHAILRLQQFVRYHIRRKERRMIVEARHLSATIVQKQIRGRLARNVWTQQLKCAIALQRRVRQYLSVRELKRLRLAVAIMKRYIVWWVCKRRYRMTRKRIVQLQRWWRYTRVRKRVRAQQHASAVRIQATWRGKAGRRYVEAFMIEHDRALAQLEAAICIQAAWRGSQQRRHRLIRESGIDVAPMHASISQGDVMTAAQDSDTLLNESAAKLSETLSFSDGGDESLQCNSYACIVQADLTIQFGGVDCPSNQEHHTTTLHEAGEFIDDVVRDILADITSQVECSTIEADDSFAVVAKDTEAVSRDVSESNEKSKPFKTPRTENHLELDLLEQQAVESLNQYQKGDMLANPAAMEDDSEHIEVLQPIELLEETHDVDAAQQVIGDVLPIATDQAVSSPTRHEDSVSEGSEHTEKDQPSAPQLETASGPNEPSDEDQSTTDSHPLQLQTNDSQMITPPSTADDPSVSALQALESVQGVVADLVDAIERSQSHQDADDELMESPTCLEANLVAEPLAVDSDIIDGDRLEQSSDSDDEREHRAESSMDSSDLLWEADTLSGPDTTSGLSPAPKPRGHSTAARMDSSRILSDLRHFSSEQ